MTEDIIIQSDESDEFIERLIKSFDLSFEDLGLRSGMTFQELIDNITQKLGRHSSTDCSTQIVFYRLRQILTKEHGFSKEKITRNALLDDLFPKSSRKKLFKLIGNELNIDINYYQSPGWFQFTCAGIILSSFILLFFQPLLGGLTLLSTLFIAFIFHKLSRTIPMKTYGELVDRVTRDNLIKLRGDRNSLNPSEIRMTIIKAIDDLHALEKLDINSSNRIIFE
ncbi:MAG: hypothetical protein V4667_06905 [Bacteroidota bacterium]